MKAFLYDFRRNDTGAAQVIEMTLIFPLVLMVLGFLIFMGSYIMQGVEIYNDAQRIAVAASREVGAPGYSKLYGTQGVTSYADFNWADGTQPDIALINEMMKEHKPYRYWGNELLSRDKKTSLENNLERLVRNSSFLAPSYVDCNIVPINNYLNQQVQVTVVKTVATPQFIRVLGLTNALDIKVTATAVVGDPAEFIRNTDMVFDMTEYLFDNLKIGKSNQTVNEKIAIYKQKFTDTAAKLGITW